jgi:hypothetical protein
MNGRPRIQAVIWEKIEGWGIRKDLPGEEEKPFHAETQRSQGEIL